MSGEEKIIEDLKPIKALVKKVDDLRTEFRNAAKMANMPKMKFPSWTYRADYTVIAINQYTSSSNQHYLLIILKSREHDTADYILKLTEENLDKNVIQILKDYLADHLKKYLHEQMREADTLITKNLNLQDKLETVFK